MQVGGDKALAILEEGARELSGSEPEPEEPAPSGPFGFLRSLFSRK